MKVTNAKGKGKATVDEDMDDEVVEVERWADVDVDRMDDEEYAALVRPCFYPTTSAQRDSLCRSQGWWMRGRNLPRNSLGLELQNPRPMKSSLSATLQVMNSFHPIYDSNATVVVGRIPTASRNMTACVSAVNRVGGDGEGVP